MIVARSLSWRRVAHSVGRPMLGYFVWAVAVSTAYYFKFDRLFFPSLPISLLAATLGILLGFRNNSGYDRWWEARTLWGGLVNQSRTFARQLLTFLPAPERPAGDGAGLERRGEASAVARTRLTETALQTVPATGAGEGRRHSDGAVRDLEGHASWEHAAHHRVNPGRRIVFRRRPAAHAHAAADGTTAPEIVPPEAAGGADGATAAPSPAPARVTECCHFDQVSGEARELVYAQIGYVNALRCHLRRQDPLPDVTPFFRPEVVDALRGEQNVPAAILVWMATRLRRLLDGRRPDDVFRLASLDETLTELTNLMGGCERIKNTPIPRQYDFLPRVMVRAYLVVLPLGMVRDLGLFTPIISAVIAFLFLSLDQIGRNVEAPFENDVHDTPMTALCRTIEINLRQMLGEAELPPAAQPVDGYLY